MVRTAMSTRRGGVSAPTAPTRRQLQQERTSSAQAEPVTEVSPVKLSPRGAALQRRRALTTSGKAAQLSPGSVSGGRIRTSADRRRPEPSRSQPGWVRRDQPSSQKATFNLSRSSLPITHRQHPLTDAGANASLRDYEQRVKGRFDRIVPMLKQVSALQHEPDFIEQAQRLTRAELGFDLPDHILQKSWVRPLDMRALFAWCVFESHRLFSDRFFQDDPLGGSSSSPAALESPSINKS